MVAMIAAIVPYDNTQHIDYISSENSVRNRPPGILTTMLAVTFTSVLPLIGTIAPVAAAAAAVTPITIVASHSSRIVHILAKYRRFSICIMNKHRIC